MESEIEKIGIALSTLKNQELNNGKFNSLIDLIIKQNEISGIVYKMANMTMERSFSSLNNVKDTLESHNKSFENAKKWMDFQNKYNDDVVEKFNELTSSINKIKDK